MAASSSSSSECAACGRASFDGTDAPAALDDQDEHFWIQCDRCDAWFHGKCINVEEYESALMERYHCGGCERVTGPSEYKPHVNDHRYAFDDELAGDKPVQVGTKRFVQLFKKRKSQLQDARCEIVVLKSGRELTMDRLSQNGWDRPILVESISGLDIQLPDKDFYIHDLLRLLGSEYMVDVIDVFKQHSYRMSLGRFVQIWDSPKRPRLYNILSLEASHTKLAEMVKVPRLVTEMSWVHQLWPSGSPPAAHKTGAAAVAVEHAPLKPEVALFCLMGMRNSYTDFHIDFGGSSVWYHVFKGEKEFFLLAPTEANIAAFEAYGRDACRTERWFGDEAAVKGGVRRLVVREGETVLIPSGWLHAVCTPQDSLVFGGNFLHSLHAPMQLRIYRMETALNTDPRFMFPSFELTSWYAAQQLCDTLKEANDDGLPVDGLLRLSAKALVAALKEWNAREKTERVRKTLTTFGKTAQLLQKELTRHQKLASGGPKGTAKRKAVASRKTAGQSPPAKRAAKKPSNAAVNKQDAKRIIDDEPSHAPIKLKLSLCDPTSLAVTQISPGIVAQPPAAVEGLKLSFGVDRLLVERRRLRPSEESSDGDGEGKEEPAFAVLSGDDDDEKTAQGGGERVAPLRIGRPTSKPKAVSAMFGVSAAGRRQKPSAWVAAADAADFAPDRGGRANDDQEFLYPSLVDFDEAADGAAGTVQQRRRSSSPRRPCQLPPLTDEEIKDVRQLSGAPAPPPMRKRGRPPNKTTQQALAAPAVAAAAAAAPQRPGAVSATAKAASTSKKGSATAKQRLANKLKMNKRRCV